MEAPVIEGLGTSNRSAAGLPARRGMQSLTSEDFFRILVTELQQQDPLEPAKTSDMISNVSQIRSIELAGRLNETLDRLARQQRAAGAAELIGKHVRALVADEDGTAQTIEGVVTGASVDDQGEILLELDNGQSVRLADVRHISQPAAAGQPGPSGPRAAGATSATNKTRSWLSLENLSLKL